ncbi:MAG: TonB-dependent receptor plug domain-containing protein [Gemmatimonadota bacterium]
MSGRIPWSTGACFLALILPLTRSEAQQASPGRVPDATTVQSISGMLLDHLPVDRLDSALILLPGVTPLRFGGLSIRGGEAQDVVTWLDGVPISSGFRNNIPTTFGLFPAPLGNSTEVGTNALERVSVVTGPLPARFGNAQGGAVLLESSLAAGTFAVRGSFESDGLSGNLHSAGFNRFKIAGGTALTSRFHLFMAGSLDGYDAIETGPGAEADPLFLPVGIDTTLMVPTVPGDPFSDTTLVDVARFAVTRGKCDAFGSSSNPGIAGNYGVKCAGIRAPSTGNSRYQLLGKLVYSLPGSGRFGSLLLTGLASQEQGRGFNPGLAFVPQDQPAFRGTNRVITLALNGMLLKPGQHPITLDAALSLQRDRTLAGSLTNESELATRDGVLFSQLHFAFDFETFPIDDDLISNIRNNTAGSRRNPLDVENSSQFDYVDRYRNSPYGLGGGPEQGGPQGAVSLLRENRSVGQASIGWRPGTHHFVEAGVELTRYSVSGYSGRLASLAGTDAFSESPSRAALYLLDEINFDDLVVSAGVRYDRFHSNAARPFVLDTVSSSPRFNTYSYFPTPNSYGFGGIAFNGQPLVKFVDDEARSTMSPRLQVAFTPAPGTTLHAGYASQSEVPDLAMILSGINTDLRTTSINHVFGSDLDFEQARIYELGAMHRIGKKLVAAGSIYYKDLESQAVFRSEPFADPARFGAQVDIRHATNLGIATISGAEISALTRSGPFAAMVGYAYQQVRTPDDTHLITSRPHSVTSILSFELPDGWHPGSTMGHILENTRFFATMRYMSGAAYTACPVAGGNDNVISGEPCAGAFAGDFLGARLPATKQLDLRESRSLDVAGHQLTAYVDARNVLNFHNVLAVFATTGQTSNPAARDRMASTDSIGFVNEGRYNGVWQPNGDIDLTFGGAVAGGCGNWRNAAGVSATPNCVYLIRAEERFGDGDHIFTPAEQLRSFNAHYDSVQGEHEFLGTPRRIRLGLELEF